MESTFALADRLTPRQRELVGELMELFLSEGFAQLTLDDIAGRLGCSKRTLYALADSKEQLAVRTVRYFFKRSTEQVEATISRTRSPSARVTRYLEAVAEALRPAGPQFRTDLAHNAATREVYEQNTMAAAVRVRELIDDGIRAGAFRNVSAVFVGEVVTATMRRITSGEIGQATGLDDAQAYAELAKLVVAAIRR